MSDPVRPAALLPGDMPSRWRVWRTWLLRTFPGRALVLGARDQGDHLAAQLRRHAAAGARSDRHGRQPRAAVCARLRPDAIRGVGEAPAAVARAPQADPLVRVRRRGAGAARDHVLPARGTDPRVQRQLVPRAVARHEPDRPGAFPRADGAARSAARDARAEALAETLERRQSSTETRYPFISIAVVPVANLDVQGRAGTSRARAEGAARRRCRSCAGRWGHLPPPTALPKWVGCDGFSGSDRLQRAAQRRSAVERRRKRGW